MADRGQIIAAGGAVWRGEPGADPSQVELAVIHRPRYDDWSLPKGKSKPGETMLATAVREVGEEIGSRVAVSRRLSQARYRVNGTPKRVGYWVMRDLGGRFVPGAEVDEVAWLPLDQAAARCSYGIDRDVITEFSAVPVPDAVIILVRHARAGRRSAWPADDLARPLDSTGRRQAQRLATVLPAFAPTRLVSAEPARCVQTLQPLSEALQLPIEVDETFGDDHLRAGYTAKALLELAVRGSVTVVCSQGSTIPAMIGDLYPQVRSTSTRKGATWTLCVRDGLVTSADYGTEALSSS